METRQPRISKLRAALIFAQFLIVIGLLWSVVWNVDMQKLLSTLKQAEHYHLAIAVGILATERLVRCYRLAKLLNGRIGFFKIVAAQSVSQLVNIILPMRSGEMLLVVILRSIGEFSASYSLSIVAIDRLMDLVCVLLIFALTLTMAPGLPAQIDQTAIALAIISAAIVFTIVIAVFARDRALSLIRRTLLRVTSPARAAGWSQRFEHMIEGLGVVLDPWRIVPAVFATFAAWGCATLGLWLILEAIWPNAPFAAAALAISLAVIGITVVSVPAGIGVIHAAFAFAAIAFGASPEVALAFAVVGHFLGTMVTVAMGILGVPLAKRTGSIFFRGLGQTRQPDNLPP